MAPAIRWTHVFWCFYITHVLFFLYPPYYDSCNAKIKVCNVFKITFHFERPPFGAKKPIYSVWPFYTPAQSSTAPCALLSVGGIVRRKRSRELRFGEFAPESSAFFGVKKLRKWFHGIWSYLDILRPCTKKSDHVVHDLKDKNTTNKVQ